VPGRTLIVAPGAACAISAARSFSSAGIFVGAGVGISAVSEGAGVGVGISRLTTAVAVGAGVDAGVAEGIALVPGVGDSWFTITFFSWPPLRLTSITRRRMQRTAAPIARYFGGIAFGVDLEIFISGAGAFVSSSFCGGGGGAGAAATGLGVPQSGQAGRFTGS
jgi:hypothetical protein